MFAGTTPPRQIDLITVDPAGNFLEAFRSVFRFFNHYDTHYVPQLKKRLNELYIALMLTVLLARAVPSYPQSSVLLTRPSPILIIIIESSAERGYINEL